MKKLFSQIAFYFLIVLTFTVLTNAQNVERKFSIKTGGVVQIKNLYGRIDVKALEEYENSATLNVTTKIALSSDELEIDSSNEKLKIKINPKNREARVDVLIQVPVRSKVQLETDEGQISVAGDLESVVAKSNTGTIYADVPINDFKYKFLWSGSRPRFVSDVELEDYKEKSAGKFVLKGEIKKEVEKSETLLVNTETTDDETENEVKKSQKVSLNFRTVRGIILLNVPPNEVPSDLTERPLTNAAKAIIKSGDTLLTSAIRRASPKYFGDYAATLPPRKSSPFLKTATDRKKSFNAGVKKVNVQVVDINNRAVSGLNKDDFVLSERGDKREIISVEKTDSPFNLVLLLDVSGSIENYVDFIRKAARNFVRTVSPQDKLSIVIFNEDVKTISTFTTDKFALSESLDTFDAGGGTAYYDSIAYVLTDTLRPMKGERTAIVVLSDGDDNRSFLPFKSLLGSIQESGALVYPLYVPSGLIAASADSDLNKVADPLRSRFLSQTLTSKAQKEGETLAQISGGVYYPISRLSELQNAYDDIVKQLRTSYSITFRSETNETGGDISSPRLKVKVNKDNTFVKVGTVVAVENKDISNVKFKSPKNKKTDNFTQKIRYSKKKNSFEVQKKNRNSSDKLPEITGEISQIKYKPFLADKLRTKQFETLEINKTRGAFLVNIDNQILAVSRWISPKRTRSYPYERVYDTLAHSGKKVAIIPVVKDEGKGGDRDFIQWDTISLLSLLDVHVVLAYYDDAIKNPKRADKITKQKFNNEFIKQKLSEVNSFNGNTRDWNEKESNNLKEIFTKAKLAYREISRKTKTYLHNEDRLDERIKFAETPQRFIGYSRRRSRKAQTREFLTIQPNEALSTLSKGKITITNGLFGKYYFTVDETLIEPHKLSLIEAKHSRRSKMPSKNDIKDGLIKMMLYTNLQKVKFGKQTVNHKVMIRLTSDKINGSIDSEADLEVLKDFVYKNSLTKRNLDFLEKLFQEAKTNNFKVLLERGETAK